MGVSRTRSPGLSIGTYPVRRRVLPKLVLSSLAALGQSEDFAGVLSLCAGEEKFKGFVTKL